MKIFRSIFMILLVIFIMSFSQQTTKALNAYDLADLDVRIDSEGLPYIEQYKNQVDQASAWNEIFSNYKAVLTGISGLLTLTFVVLFMKMIFDFGKTAENPQERQRCIKGLLWTGIGAGGFASTTFIMALAFKFLQ